MDILSNDVAVPMGFNWDLYLIAVLFALLSYIIYLRRPNRQPQNAWKPKLLIIFNYIYIKIIITNI